MPKASHISTPEFSRMRKYNCPQEGAANILNKIQSTALNIANTKRT